MNDIYTLSMLMSMAVFILTTHLTPGPTNVVLLSSVLSFGYKKSMPFMIANIISYPLMMIFVALGLGLFLVEHPMLMSILKIVGILYLCWMAWKIFKDSSTYEQSDKKNEPFTFFQSLIYPWLNPKAWVIYTSTLSIFVSSSTQSSIQISVIVIFIFIAMIITTYVWAFAATTLKKFLKNEKFIKVFNKIMAVLLLGSVVPVIIQ